MPFFSKQDIDNAKAYKYNGKDDSLLVRFVYRSFWNWLIEFFPKWIAPNLITFIGWLFEVVSFTISFCLSEKMTKPLPSWACLMNGICLAIYQTLDNLDGRQARRTGLSSALGQFFDHGCDALTGAFELAKVAMTLQLSNEKAFWFIFLMGIGFSITSWEEYVTHAFYLGYFNGPDEGLTILWIVQILACFIPEQMKAIGNSSFVSYGFIIAACLTILEIFFNVFKNCIQNHSFIPRILGILPMTVLFFIFLLIFIICHDYVVNQSFFILSSGLSLQFLAQNIIISFLTKRNWPKLFTIPTILVIGTAFGALVFPQLNENQNFWEFYLFGLVALMLYFDVRSIYGLSRGMGIPIFTVPKGTKIN